MPSFDVVSEVDLHEIRNAVDQAVREMRTRFDFRNVEADIELEEKSILLTDPALLFVCCHFSIKRTTTNQCKIRCRKSMTDNQKRPQKSA